MSSMVGYGVCRGRLLASSAGRTRHELKIPVRSMWGPGKSTDAPTFDPASCSWA